ARGDLATLKLCSMDGCENPLPPRHSRYCSLHSHFAGVLWKRRQRAELRKQGRSAHLEYFLTKTETEEEARLAYNAYRRVLRRRRREVLNSGNTELTALGDVVNE